MVLILIIVLVYCGLLVYICPPTVSIGDTAELVGTAATLGIAHSPGYPLFCNIYKIFTTILPLGDFGYRTALGSVLLFFLTAIVSSIVVKNLTKNFFTVLFSLTFLLSQNSLTRQNIAAEVFALHNLIFIVVLYVVFFENMSYKKRLYLVSFLLGLSFGNQHITVFYLPGVILYFIYEWHKNRKSMSMVFKDFLLVIIFFFLGLSIYLYVPIRSLRQPLYDWEDPETLDRFLYLFTRGRYGTLSLAQGGAISISIDRLYSAMKLYAHILGPKNVALLIVSLILWLKTIKKIDDFIRGTMLVIIIFFAGIFFITISGLKSVTPNNIFILERLITVSILSLVIFVTFFLSQPPNKIVVLGIIMVLNCVDIVKNLIYLNQRENFFLYDYTINIFRNLPYNSILLSDRADETEFSIAYYQRLLKKRTDVEFIDCNASVTRSVYGEDYYKIWGKPRLEIRNKVESMIVRNSSRPVIYNTVLPQQTTTKKYRLGLVHSTVPTEDVIPNEIFLIRNIPRKTAPREFGLYITYLELLSQYYFELSLSDKKFIDIAKSYFSELFLNTEDPRYLGYIAYYYFVKNEFSTSAVIYSKMLDYITEPIFYAETLVNLGVVYEKMRHFKQAEDCYFQAIKVKRDYKLAYYNLGSLYLKLGRKEDAIKFFKAYLELAPEDEHIKNLLARLMQKI